MVPALQSGSSEVAGRVASWLGLSEVGDLSIETAGDVNTARDRLQQMEEGIARVRRAGLLALRRFDLAIDGRDVMQQLGWAPGPRVGQALAYLTDRVVEERGDVTRIERIRAWDACTSTNYRRAAGGHNSRPTKPGRIRNRFFCKFCYYPEDFGPLGCVGCGRCIVSCPVDIDITEVMRDVAAQ